MTSVKIYLYVHKTLKDESHPIVLQIIKDRKRKMVTIATAYPKEWNFYSEIPNSKHPNAKQLRSLIRKKKNLAESAIIELDEIGKPYTVDDVAERLEFKKQTTSFEMYTDKLISQLKKANKNGNARAYTDAKNAFIKFNNGKDIDLKNITSRKIKQFENKMEEKGLKVNSISVYLRTIRAIYNKAIKEELVHEKYYPFKNYKIRKEKTVKRALDKILIKKIVDLEIEDDAELELARDVFLFSFYNRGMNFVDIFYLTIDEIRNGRLEYRRRKTSQLLSLKLTNESILIIEKYKLKGEGDYVFPILSEKDEYQSYKTGLRMLNKRLKRIGKRLEINTSLTSYVARHSWATIAKRSGISTSIISESMGHESELTTQIYLDSFENETLDEANDKVLSLFE